MISIVKFGRYQLILEKAAEQEHKREIPSLLIRLRALMKKLNQYRETARQRKQLAQLPDYLLKDIGVSRSEALKEAEKPFWK